MSEFFIICFQLGDRAPNEEHTETDIRVVKKRLTWRGRKSQEAFVLRACVQSIQHIYQSHRAGAHLKHSCFYIWCVESLNQTKSQDNLCLKALKAPSWEGIALHDGCDCNPLTSTCAPLAIHAKVKKLYNFLINWWAKLENTHAWINLDRNLFNAQMLEQHVNNGNIDFSVSESFGHKKERRRS